MPGFAYPHDPYRVILCYVIVDTLGQQTDLGPVRAFDTASTQSGHLCP